jgi:hypothetical protein
MTDTQNTKDTYNPNAPEVLRFMAERDAALPFLSDRNRVVNHPWPEGSDSQVELQLKARWRKLRGLSEQPFSQDKGVAGGH